MSGGQFIFSQTNTNVGKNGLAWDAWGRAKFITDHSLFHGMFTYNIPVSTWYEVINGVESATITNYTSSDGALKVLAGAALNDDSYLRTFRNLRYAPNRGALYSTAGWIENPTAIMTREFGTFTAESGVFFRLKSGGTLVGVVRTTTTAVGTVDDEIPLTIPAGVDLSKGNVFDIQYQWRGVGDYKFFLNLQEVGNSNYLGTLTQLSMYNPSLPIAFNSVNLGDNDPMYFGCVDVSSEGGNDSGKIYGSLSTDNLVGQVSITGYNIPIIAIRNKLTVGTLINTRDVLALLASGYSDNKSLFRIWKTRDFTAITENNQSWVDYGDGHMEYIHYDNPNVATPMTFDTAKASLSFGSRVGQDTTYTTNLLFEGRTEVYLTPGDMFVFTMHRESGSTCTVGATFEFAESI